MKYKTIKELVAGFKNGELEGYSIYMDNDSSGLTYTGPGSDDFHDDMNDKADKLWSGDGYMDICNWIKEHGIDVDRV